MAKRKRAKSMKELTKGFGKFIAGKETNPDNKQHFEKAIRKAVKRSGSK